MVAKQMVVIWIIGFKRIFKELRIIAIGNPSHHPQMASNWLLWCITVTFINQLTVARHGLNIKVRAVEAGLPSRLPPIGILSLLLL